MRRWPLAAAALLAGLAVFTLELGEEPPSTLVEQSPVIRLADVLGGEQAGFERATRPRAFRFPADHGPHPGYRSEWWYYSGNLDTPDGRHFGFTLTFFRFALAPGEAKGVSPWRTHQLYMAHLSVTDVAEQRFLSFERLGRGAVGLAGARAAPFRVWLADWEAAQVAEDLFPLRLRAGERRRAGIELELLAGKPLVPQGERGLSRKSAEPGNASYYYSFTRLPVRGEVWFGAEAYPVEGLAWMDREWSTSALADDQEGWDWFSLQLDDGRELMLYRLRRRDGSADPMSAGVIVSADGVATPLGHRDFELTPLDRWESGDGEARYPFRWQLMVPSHALELEVTAYLPDQELDHSVRYWEGAASVLGVQAGQPVAGDGYLEMTGYGEGG